MSTPILARHPVVDPKTGLVTPEWGFFFSQLSALVDAAPSASAAADSFAALAHPPLTVLVTDQNGAASFGPTLPVPTQLAITHLGTINGPLKATGPFGVNGAAAQAAVPSGGALAAYGAGANGYDTAGHASALHALVVAMRNALVASGLMT